MLVYRPTPVTTITASGATQALTFSADGSPACYDITLTANCTFTVAGGVPGIRQAIQLLLRTGTGTFTVTLPAGVLWHNNVTPTFTTVAAKIIDLNLSTSDGGTTLIGK